MAFPFEKLVVYQKSVTLYVLIVELRIPNLFEHKHIRNQLLRSALSISLNIAEGSGKESLRDRKNFLHIARGSLYETVANLNILRHSKLIDTTNYEKLYALSTEISKMLHALIQKHLNQ